MAIENENLFDDTKLTDILKEYYMKIREDRERIDQIIDNMELDRPLISPFEAEGRARLIGALLEARQKTTNGLSTLINAVARLQSNAKTKDDSDDDLFFEAAKLMEQIEQTETPEIPENTDEEETTKD